MNFMETRRKTSQKTGELLVKEGLIHQGDIQRVIDIQGKHRASLGRNKERLFGMILCDLNLTTPTDIYWVLKKHGKLLSLQEALIQKQILSRSVVEKIQNGSIKGNIPFMSLLLEDGIISKTLLAQILFDLFYIPLRSISNIVFDKRTRPTLSHIIKKEMAKKYKIIPLVLKGNTFVCGLTDPDNLLLIQKLSNQFPQYRFNPLFIPFSGFTWFYKLLYEEDFSPVKVVEKPVDLSLLLKFSVMITNPEAQGEAIDSLYKRYELVRSLVGFPGKGDRAEIFQAFVGQYHDKITREYRCRSVEFSLKNDPDQLWIMAFPKKQEE
jgi:hypothetical protein